ncbi:MAG TPA: hypothetical protein VHW93_08240 [Acidimicrobiales bacterium]|nr:hypothetical protein [Acidimicrobiales bacterium]
MSVHPKPYRTWRRRSIGTVALAFVTVGIWTGSWLPSSGAGAATGPTNRSTAPPSTAAPSDSTEPTTAATATPSTATPSTSAPTTTTSRSPLKAGASYHETVVKFLVCPKNKCNGEHVFIDSASNHYGPSGYSQCSGSETSTDFFPQKNGELRVVSMHALSTFPVCTSAASYNNWLIKLYGPGDKLLGQGLIWLGQNRAGTSYYSRCDPSKSPWQPVWKGLDCSVLPGGSIEVAVPRARPNYANCPFLRQGDSGAYCRLDIHLDANKYCPNITAEIGVCTGKSTGTPGWVALHEDLKTGTSATFAWDRVNSTVKVNVRYGVTAAALPIVFLRGTMAGPHSNALVVTTAKAIVSSNPIDWKTADEGVEPPGQPGGPLYVQFANGKIGADVYIQGYLEPKMK